MYNWNKSYINQLKKYLNDIDENYDEITYAKLILEHLNKKEHILAKDIYTIKEDEVEINNI